MWQARAALAPNASIWADARPRLSLSASDQLGKLITDSSTSVITDSSPSVITTHHRLITPQLCKLITDETFESIAQISVRIELSTLVGACTQFATDSYVVRRAATVHAYSHWGFTRALLCACWQEHAGARGLLSRCDLHAARHRWRRDSVQEAPPKLLKNNSDDHHVPLDGGMQMLCAAPPIRKSLGAASRRGETR